MTKKFGEGKKYTTPLTEEELNYVFEYFTKARQVPAFDEYLASAPAPKAPKVEPLKKADGTVVELKRPSQSAAAPGSAASDKKEKPAKPAQPKREIVTVRVDTRSGDINLDKFNEKYESMAGAPTRGAAQAQAQSGGKHGKQKVGPGGKQKFSQRGNNRRGQPSKKRETEGRAAAASAAGEGPQGPAQGHDPRRDHRRRAGHPAQADRGPTSSRS